MRNLILITVLLATACSSEPEGKKPTADDIGMADQGRDFGEPHDLSGADAELDQGDVPDAPMLDQGFDMADVGPDLGSDAGDDAGMDMPPDMSNDVGPDVGPDMPAPAFDPNATYVFSNEFHGVGFSLAIGPANDCEMAPADDTAPNQQFRFIEEDIDQWILVSNAAIAAGRALAGGDGVDPCLMTPVNIASPGSDHVWTFTEQNGRHFMHTNRFGNVQALDASNSPAAMALVYMTSMLDLPRQRWVIRRLP